MVKNDDWRDLLNEIKIRYQVGDHEVTSSAAKGAFATGELAFVLEIKLRELEAAKTFLEDLLQKKQSTRRLWLEDNQVVVHQLSQLIAHDSQWSLLGLKHNAQTSALSLNLAQQLKTVMGLMNVLVEEGSWLDG